MDILLLHTHCDLDIYQDPVSCGSSVHFLCFTESQSGNPRFFYYTDKCNLCQDFLQPLALSPTSSPSLSDSTSLTNLCCSQICETDHDRLVAENVRRRPKYSRDLSHLSHSSSTSTALKKKKKGTAEKSKIWP